MEENRITTVWPSGPIHYQALVSTFYLTGVPLLAICLSRRTPISIAGWRNLSLARGFVIAVLVDSLMFVYASGILVLGVGTSRSSATCGLGIWWCILFYATSKVCIYLFLMERVNIVWRQTDEGEEKSRWKSPWYCLAAAFMCLWIGVAIVMILGRISYQREESRVCVIGLRAFASIPMIVVDVIVNVYLTAAFVVPISRSSFSKSRPLAIKSSLAAMAALLTSVTNIAILTTQHGQQLSWVCLLSCGTDVTFNAIMIFLVSSGEESPRRGSFCSHFGITPFVSTQHRPSMVSSFQPTPSLSILLPPSSRRHTTGRSQSEILPSLAEFHWGLGAEEKGGARRQSSSDTLGPLDRVTSAESSERGIRGTR